MKILDSFASLALAFTLFHLLGFSYFFLEASNLLDLHIYNYEFKVSNYVLSLLFLLYFFFISHFSFRGIKTVSYYFRVLHFYFPILPTLVLLSFDSVSLDYMLFFLFIVSLTYMTSFLAETFYINIPVFRGVWALAITLIFFLAVFLYLVKGFRVDNVFEFSLVKIYELREESSNNSGALYEYLHHFFSKFVLPSLMLYCLLTKRYFLTIFFFSVSIMMFFITFHRANIFFPLFVIMIYIITNFRGLSFFNGLGLALLVVVLMGILTISIGQPFLLIGDLLLRRLFFLPSELNAEYFGFFSVQEYTYFWNSKLVFNMIDSFYQRQAAELISDFVGMPGGHANTGYIGASFQQLGWLGAVLYQVFFLFILTFLNSVGRATSNHRALFALFSVYIFWIINSSDFLPIFLTHGLLLSFIVLFFNSKLFIKRTT